MRGGRWVAPRLSTIESRTYTLAELLGPMEFKLLKWDGRTPHSLLDKAGRICAVLAGRPHDITWDDVARNASEHMTACHVAGTATRAFSCDEDTHRRGQFFNLPVGVSYGGGQRLPGNLVLSTKKQAIADELLTDRNIVRIAGFQSNCFSFYFPKIYHEYWRNLGLLYRQLPTLQANFPNISIFSACTFNLGPTTATKVHTDSANVAYGICAITALGDFDPTLGGHIILFDLGLVIQFPPGSTVLIPSALFRHGNTPIIGSNVTRQSFTQYCAGGIFRWVQYGFQTAASLVSSFPTAAEGKAQKAKIDGDFASRKAAALGLFSTIESLPGDHEKIYNLTARLYPK
ncbi:hypothetical protein BJ912DRAFT_847793 [Pholiota molesta]|nr:hypothetical protein BJ912DRAFT_847793 [Pholiota molesta]